MWLENRTSTLKISITAPHINGSHTLILWPWIPLLGIYQKEMSYVHTETCTEMTPGAFFVTAKTRKHNVPAGDGETNCGSSTQRNIPQKEEGISYWDVLRQEKNLKCIVSSKEKPKATLQIIFLWGCPKFCPLNWTILGSSDKCQQLLLWSSLQRSCRALCQEPRHTGANIQIRILANS